MSIAIQDNEITFVIQGPVQGSKERSQIEGVTERNINSIRQLFPESKLLLSTWKGQDTSGLNVDNVLLLDDPGQNTIYVNAAPQKLNNNRQLYGCAQGLKAVKTKYAAKVRTDNIVCGRGFLDLYRKFADTERKAEHSLFTQRTITSSAFFISSHYGRTVHFNKSDLFDFGLTEDLHKIWPDKLLPELRFNTKKKGFKVRPPATEQFFVLHWLSMLKNKELKINNKVNEDAGLGKNFWHDFLANNMIVASPEDIGLDVTDRFYKRGNLALEYDIQDWMYLSGLAGKPVDQKRIYRAYKYYTGKLISLGR